jgi:HD superfamily phosphohydrolase
MILRDSVHGLVSFEQDEEGIVPELIEAVEVQRLRRIRQLGLTSLAYPGADHTRFSHAIGTAFVMKKFLERMRVAERAIPTCHRLSFETAQTALAAALLHDVGHGPYSHLFEEALPECPTHEEWTVRVILDPATDVNHILARHGQGLPARVAELVRGHHELGYLGRAVSGTFDVDRCDYLLRDAHATGVSYGRFDLDWLLRSLRLSSPDGSSPRLAIDGPRGLPAIESFLFARLFMFQQVYFHKASRASEWMMSRILGRARWLVANGTELENVPPALAAIAREGEATLGEYLELDDCVLEGALVAWSRCRDVILADLCQRLRGRKLFKTYEFYGRNRSAELEGLTLARAIAARAGLDPDFYVGLDVATVAVIDDTAEPLTVLFPGGQERQPGEVSFLLARLKDEHLQQTRLVFAPELRPAIVQALQR